MNKKLLFLLSTLLLVILLVFSVGAKDIYVKSGGTGDGSSAATPIGYISQAAAALGDEGGTVYVIGEYAILANFTVPEVSGDITFSGIDGGSLALSANLYGTVNKNDNVITFDLPVSIATDDDRFIIGRYNSITFGENFTVTSAGGGKLNFFGGISAATAAEDADEAVTTLPYDIVVNNGTFARFGGGNFRGGISTMYGSIAAPISITVNGGTFGVAGDYPTDTNNKTYNSFSLSGMSILASDATLTINGGTFNMPIYAQGRTGTVPATSAEFSLQKNNTADFYAMDGEVAINITGGTFNGGAVGAYHTHAAYTQLLRGNFDVSITGGNFKAGTIIDATQVKAYEGQDKKATLTYSNVTNITPVLFDVVNGKAVTDNVEPLRVVFIGDSITEGYAPAAAEVDRLTEGYPAAFLAHCEAADLDRPVIVGNFGISASGFLPSNGRYYGDRITWDIVSKETDADVVFFAMGTNDGAGAGGTNGALTEFEKQLTYFVSEMGKVADKVFITNAIYRDTSNKLSDHRVAAVIRPIQERVAKTLATTDSKYVFVDLYGLTLDAAYSGELFKDDNGNINEQLHPARAGLDMMGKCCYDALFNNITAPAEDYRLNEIYVSDRGTAFGAGTSTSPISVLANAYALMPYGEEVTLYIDGTVTFSAGNVYLPIAPSKLNVVGINNATLNVTGANTFKIGTDTKINNVALVNNATNTTACFMACYNDFEITNSVTTNGLWAFFAGYNVFADVAPSTTATFDSVESASSDKDAVITVNSGNYSQFVLGNGRFASDAPFGVYSGTITATVGANVTVGANNHAYIGINGQNYLKGTINVTLNGWGDREIKEYAPTGSIASSLVYNNRENTGEINITLAEGLTNDVIYLCDFNNDDILDIQDVMGALKSLLDNKTSAHFHGKAVGSLLDVLYVINKVIG